MKLFNKVIPEVCGTCAHAQDKPRNYKITDEVTGIEVFFEIVCPHDKRRPKTYNTPTCPNYKKGDVFKRLWTKLQCS